MVSTRIAHCSCSLNNRGIASFRLRTFKALEDSITPCSATTFLLSSFSIFCSQLLSSRTKADTSLTQACRYRYQYQQWKDQDPPPNRYTNKAEHGDKSFIGWIGSHYWAMGRAAVGRLDLRTYTGPRPVGVNFFLVNSE